MGGRYCRQPQEDERIPLPDEPIDTERVVELWDGTGHLLLAKDFTYSQLRTPATTAHPLHANGTDFVPGSVIDFREVAGSLDTSICLFRTARRRSLLQS